ncbi:MAG: hypothetical protein M3R15_23455 [Acidobacteriota bacterium]|nr:hypothetical protein [Acidobacteriota bacterium]
MYELEYRRARGVIDARPNAERIKRVMELPETDGTLSPRCALEYRVSMMVLCAGNPISLHAPLETQFLSAHQRISDYHAGRIMLSPEEVERVLVLCHAAMIVVDALDALEKKGGAQ